MGMSHEKTRTFINGGEPYQEVTVRQRNEARVKCTWLDAGWKHAPCLTWGKRGVNEVIIPLMTSFYYITLRTKSHSRKNSRRQRQVRQKSIIKTSPAESVRDTRELRRSPSEWATAGPRCHGSPTRSANRDGRRGS